MPCGSFVCSTSLSLSLPVPFFSNNDNNTKNRVLVVVASNPLYLVPFLCCAGWKEHAKRIEGKKQGTIRCHPKKKKARARTLFQLRACDYARGGHVAARSRGLGAKRSPRGVPNKKGSRAHATRRTCTHSPGSRVRVHTCPVRKRNLRALARCVAKKRGQPEATKPKTALSPRGGAGQR